MAALVISDTFDFNSTSYYYDYDNGTGSAAGNPLVAYNYSPYATYWCYSANAVYDKHVSSVVINISASRLTIGSGSVKVFAACAPLIYHETDGYDDDRNYILYENSSSFGCIGANSAVVSTSTTNTLDITDVVKYAAENYNQPWALYIIGDKDNSNTGACSNATLNDPTFATLDISDGLMWVHNGTKWTDGIPYVHNGSTWVKAKAVYRHNGSSWVKI